MTTTGYTQVMPVTAPINKYEFTYYGFIPGYNDFDQEWITIEARSLDDANTKLSRRNICAKYAPVLCSVNGVFTVEDFKRYILVCNIWDGFKDKYGVRSRHLDLDNMSLEELEAELKSIMEIE